MKRNIKAIKKGALMHIPISQSFYTRLQDLLYHYYNQLEPEKAMAILIELEKREAQNETEEHIVTLMALIFAVEQDAEKNGVLESHEIDLPDPVVPKTP